MKEFLKTTLAACIGCFVALMVNSFFVLIGIVAIAAASSSGESTPVVPESAFLKIDLSNPVTEKANDDPFSNISMLSFEPAKKSIGILTAVKAIRNAANDPAIKFVYLNLNSINADLTHLEEIRAALEYVKESGKPIIAYADNYSQGAYYIASVADKIYIQREGSAQILGIGSSMMFFKDLLDRLGIEVQLIRHGKFKAAAEQFIANNISEANREQNQEMIDSIWDTWCQSICKSRDFNADEFNSLVNKLKIGNAESLIEYKIVDEAVTYSEMTDKLCALYGVEKEKDLKLISLAKYAKAVVKSNIKAKDKIAIIYADGEITMNGSEGITAAEYCPMIVKIRQDSSIKAVLMRVNSPGGDAQAAEMINTELQLLRKDKPLYVSFGGYAASGGYWISANSEQIFTDRTTLTGSIGVFSLAMNYGKGLKKHLDINTVEIGTHQHSNMFGGIYPLDNEEQEYMRTFVEDIYTKFIDLVSEGRSLEKDYVDEIAQGRVWTGAQAIENHLADKTGGIYDALEAMAADLGYTTYPLGSEDFKVVEYPVTKNSFDKFLSSLEEVSAGNNLIPEEIAEFSKCYEELKSQKGIVTYARIPYIYQFQY